ncbi:MAG: hypothetical protein KBF58_01185 [Methyloversatilis sp.]|jgi:hypothetical protein|nr:hypothetical protein [Methyloversatilis sp.]MBP6194063.1 hypothetical protein [Methyloversatilis sp.]MBP9116671.1 hypothetical protein [Methyloversatilis sp.]
MTPRLFRALIALYLLCVVLAVTSHVLTAPDLPPPLRGHVEAQDAVSWMVGAGGMAYLVLASIATAGLMLFRSWARPLFAVVAVCGAMPWDGATIYPALEHLFVNELMLAGALIALSYGADLRPRFDARADSPVRPASGRGT